MWPYHARLSDAHLFIAWFRTSRLGPSTASSWGLASRVKFRHKSLFCFLQDLIKSFFSINSRRHFRVAIMWRNCSHIALFHQTSRVHWLGLAFFSRAQCDIKLASNVATIFTIMIAHLGHHCFILPGLQLGLITRAHDHTWLFFSSCFTALCSARFLILKPCLTTDTSARVLMNQLDKLMLMLEWSWEHCKQDVSTKRRRSFSKPLQFSVGLTRLKEAN